MAKSKPGIVIVPGAWHKPIHYTNLSKPLIAAGWDVTTCNMPSVGPPEPLPDMSQDVNVVREAIQAYISAGKDVVVIMHSIGGTIGSAACKGLLPQDTPNGHGVVSLIYLAAYAMEEGFIFVPTHERTHADWCNVHGTPGTGVWMSPDNPPYTPEEIFYHDCTPEATAEAMKYLERNYSENVMHCPHEYSAWKEIESSYLVCELDKAIPVAFQDWMVGQKGGKFKRVERLQAGHSPFLSRPEETERFVLKCLEGY